MSQNIRCVEPCEPVVLPEASLSKPSVGKSPDASENTSFLEDNAPWKQQSVPNYNYQEREKFVCTTDKFVQRTLSKLNKTNEHTGFSAVPPAVHAAVLSITGSANLDKWELPGLVSALRGRKDVFGDWFMVNTPEADDGLELEHQALAVSCPRSLPAVDGRVPLPPEEGLALRWLGEQLSPSAFGDNVDAPHTFDEDEDLLPQLREPLIEAGKNYSPIQQLKRIY